MTELMTMTRDEAERLTERIRLTATTYMEAKEKLVGLIRQAREGGAHEALGFKSWTAYAEAVCSDTPLMQLTRDQRRELVSELADEGMSTRAIAPIVGVGDSTVQRDLADAPSGAPDAEPRQITGRDGKTYSAPSPSEAPKPRAESIVSQFTSAVVDLNRVMARLHRITEQDAFPRNTSKIAELHGSDLTRAATELSTINNSL